MIEHRNAWTGFRVLHPEGWSVSTIHGSISVVENSQPLVSALSASFRLPQPEAAPSVALRLISMRRAADPSIRAFLAPDSNSTRAIVRLTSRTADGLAMVHVQGTQVWVAGYQAPAAILASKAKTLTDILGSFAPIQPIPKTVFQDPTEGAFAIQMPAGWQAQGGVRRDPGYGVLQCEARGAGGVMVSMSSMVYMFSQTGMIWGAAVSPYQTASQMIQNFFIPEYRKRYPDLSIVSLDERPDLAEPPRQDLGLTASSTALATVRFTEASVPFTARCRVNTYDAAPYGSWSGEMPWSYRAPAESFAPLQPVLQGVVDSFRLNPAWEQREHAMRQGRIMASQQDILRRTREISQTLSQTSDIVANSYWERQKITEHLSHDWSNATLGYEDRVSDSGVVYNVPSGYDRVWQDNQGYFYGGNWLTTPDPSWQELKLVR
jgi:hypothetical protein